MTINTGQFEIEILKKLNASANTSDIQALATAKEFLKSSDVFVVTNYSDLPAASSVPAGSLYFVEADELLYIPAQNLFEQIVWRQLYDTDYGVIWGFGFNNSGELGDKTTVSKCSPVSVIGGFTDWCQINSGGGHSIAIRNGTLWTWGAGGSGQLGDGTTVNKSSPVSVIGGFTDWCQISSGQSHSSVVRTNGTLWVWGNNSSGQLGINSTTDRSSPTSVIGGFTDWYQAASGATHTLAIRQNGTLWAWGNNGQGRLGRNSTAASSSPVSVVGGFADWCQVSAGCAHSAAIRTNGTLWTWGCAANGILGTNSTVSRSSPTCVVGFSDWCQVSLGLCNSAAIRTNGSLWTWGSNNVGQLGVNTTVARSSPVSVVGGFTDWCQVSFSIGSTHVSALRTNGTLWSWGSGTSGRLGDGTAANRSSPVSEVGGFTDWYQISAGGGQTLGIRRKVF